MAKLSIFKDRWSICRIIFVDFKFLIKCEHVGENSALTCQKHEMRFSNGFPNHEDSQMSKSENIFGLDFPTGNEWKYDNEKEVIALCKNKENLDIWLDAVSKKTYLFSGYNKVINTKMLEGNT